MKTERWRRIDEIYARVRECAAKDRTAFLAEACGDDHELRREIESLLAHDGRSAQFMERPAVEVAAKAMARTGRESLVGRPLNHYRIVSFLGAGGMGEVYLANDTKLNRNVAIKILPEAFAQDRQRVARFHREAQLLAALNHPRIAAIYGLEESDGLSGLALELVEGETLAERIARGRVPVDEAMGIARQIAEALEAAHAKGVVHRDLKPANIKIKRDGTVKVLDFGLAKIFEPALAAASVSSVSTEENVVLGTASYMSPEQARGKEVDKRTDVWAWGCVLYEMLTGGRPFDGDTTADVIARIVTDEPDWSRLPENTPGPIRTLLRRSLQKDPGRRLQDIGDARIELDELSTQSSVIQEAHAIPNRLPWVVASVALVVAVAGFAIAYMRQGARNTAIVRFTVPAPKNVFSYTGVPELAISPDGLHLAFAARYDDTFRLFVRRIDTVEARVLPATEGAGAPFWSPDSRFIVFTASRKLKKIAVDGGSPELLSDNDGGYGTWNRDGVILIAPAGSGIYRVSAAGGTPTRLTSPKEPESGHRFPFFLPDGRHFLYNISSPQAEVRGVYVGSLDSNERKRILDVATYTIYSDGHLLWIQCPLPDVNCEAGKLMAQPFDVSQLEKRGNPVPVAEGAGRNGWLGSLSASNTGVLAYGGPSLHGLQLAWFDRAGRPLQTVGQMDFPRRVRLSSDGKRAVLDLFKPLAGTHDLLLVELAAAIFSPFMLAPSNEIDPVWSAHADVAFASNRKDAEGIYVKKVGDNNETLLLPVIGARVDDWSQDGRFIIYHDSEGQSLYSLPLLGERKPVRLLRDSFEKGEFKLSADGRWIAYNSNESGKTEVYLAAFPSMTARRQVSNAGGGIPRWRRDGRELYYLSVDGKVMAVEVKTTANEIETGTPRMLFPTRLLAPDLTTGKYDVTSDGQKFLVLQPDPNSSSPPITVVINWLDAIKKGDRSIR